MKKLLLILFLLCAVSMVFALDIAGMPLSIGASTSYGNKWFTQHIEAGDQKGDFTLTFPVIGFQGFLSIPYAQVSVGYLMSIGNVTSKQTGDFGTGEDTSADEYSWISFEALGKYPIDLGMCTFFPALGIEYDMYLNYKFEDGSGPSDGFKDFLNQLWIKTGVGFDFDVGSIYIRPSVLLGYKFNAKFENDATDALLALGFDTATWTNLRLEGSLAVGLKL